jgi:hypothetical protein
MSTLTIPEDEFQRKRALALAECHRMTLPELESHVTYDLLFHPAAAERDALLPLLHACQALQKEGLS